MTGISSPKTSSSVPACSSVAGNDTTTSCGSLTFALATGPAHGSLTFINDGTFTYVPALNYNGPDSFTYTVNDAAANESATRTVNLSLSPVNDAAQITGQATGSITEDVLPNSVSGYLDSTDVDNPADSWTVASGSTAHGTWTVTAAGMWTFVLDNTNSQVQALTALSVPLTDVFTVTTVDGTSQQVTITINGANEPVAAPTLAAVFNGTGDTNDNDDAGGAAAANAVIRVNGNPNPSGAAINGSNLDDVIHASAGDDTVYGHDGDDIIRGEQDADTSLYGQRGNDTLTGGSGSDSIYGYEVSTVTTANDTNTSDAGDSLYGGSGGDFIYGQFGNDLIIGGFGADELRGHGGADTFKFIDARDRGDILKDFSNADGDILDFSGIDANSANGSGTNEAFASLGTSAAAFGLWYQYDAINNVTHVYGDTDGNVGTAEFWIDLAGNIDLAATQAAAHVIL